MTSLNLKKLLSAPQLKIGIAVGASGLSQAVLVLVPTFNLDVKNASNLVLWQSLSTGAGILLSSILGVFTFSRILLNSTNDVEFSPDYADLLPNFMYFFSIVLLVLLPISFSLFETDKLSLTFFLAISLLGFLFMAVQRNYYAAIADWNSVSFQFGIDGVVRLIATFVIVTYFESTVFVLILASVLSQVLSIALPSLISPWWNGFKKSTNKFHVFIIEVLPLVSTTLGSLALTTFPPVFLKALGSPIELVTALGVLMILMRMPSTVLNPLVIPQVREISQHHLKGLYDSEFRLFSNIVLKLFLFAIPTATFMSVIAIKFIPSGENVITLNQVDALTRLLLVLIGTFFVVEGFANSCINGQSRFMESGLVYFVATCLFLTSLNVVGNSLISVLAMLLLATTFVFVWLFIRIYTGSRSG